MAKVAGAPPVPLIARHDRHVLVAGRRGSRVEFVMDNDGAVERVVVHPDGVFRPEGAASPE